MIANLSGSSLPHRVSRGSRLWRRLGQRLGAKAAAGTALAVGCVAMLTACQSFLSYLSLESAYKPPAASKVSMQGTLRLWAGDMNFHLSPPDDPRDVRRDMRQSMELLAKSGLDFVYVTPKIKARFYENAEEFERVRSNWLMVQQTLSSLAEPHPLVMLGAEYTDEKSGSVSILGVDLPKVLAEVTRDEFRLSPTAFMNLVALRGGILILNQPLATPLPVPMDTSLRYASRDHSWRPLTKPGPDYPADITTANKIYDGMEAYSLPVSVWRDQYVLENPTHSLVDVLARMAKESQRMQRRLVATGGSDSRGKVIRATTFIASSERTSESLRQAILRGRVCVRSPTPCGVRAYADEKGGETYGVGDAMTAEHTVQFRWGDADGDLYRNGERLGTFEGGTVQAVTRGECHIYQLYLNNGFSGPMYVNCPFAASFRP